MGFQVGKGWKNTYVNVASSWINQNNEFGFFDPIKQQNRNSFNSHLDHQNIRLVAAHTLANHAIKLISEMGKVNRGLGFLYGSELKHLKTQLMQQYKQILINSSPMLNSIQILHQMCQAVVVAEEVMHQESQIL